MRVLRTASRSATTSIHLEGAEINALKTLLQRYMNAPRPASEPDTDSTYVLAHKLIGEL